MQRITQNKLKTAIKFGECAKRICYVTRNYKNFMDIIPNLFLALMRSQQIQEMVKLLQEFHLIIRNHYDREGLIWYYALSMDMLLDSYHNIITYDECDKFYLEILSTTISEKYARAYERFLANFSLWSIRNNLLEKSELIIHNMRNNFSIRVSSNVNDIFTAIRLLEILTMHVKDDVVKGNMENAVHILNKAKVLLNDIRKKNKISQCFDELLKFYQICLDNATKFELSSIIQLFVLEKRVIKKKDFYSLNLIRKKRLAWSKKLKMFSENE